MDRNRKIDIMGIVNITDDSYFAESRCVDVRSALERVSLLIDEGADIVDIGACSTRPGSVPVGEEEEWRRLEPVLKAVREAFPHIRLSIDTCWSSVVRKVYDLIGDFIVNDISAGEDDPEMLPTVGGLGVKYVAMHKRGTPQTMQQMTDYHDVVEAVRSYFDDFSVKAARFGINDWILDPGIGFAKTIEQNYELISRLDELKTVTNAGGTSPRLLVGLSRKSLIYKYLNISPEESLPATQVLHLAVLQKGADILRVHDVAEARRTVMLYGRL
jgi:dihydropteroate synthase